MVINMKRKRREECPSPLLDDSPKRTKVHAQRKFAQGTNPSPVLTPVVQEIEHPEIDILPEPVELLPIKRPNTEDFLTFLCFRGTPILPPSLNFFNTASIVDTNGQVHGLKSESPKNGPIDTCSMSKSGSGSSERPFIAFGVRKRADPIVISRQMDKKRRHALALQALRRKYQEQKMAKIRSVTISKLSEKPKTLLRSNSVVKTETVTKKNPPGPKPSSLVKDITKVATRSDKTLRPQIKQKMCLRSFRGRFVQKELQFRNVKKRALPVKKIKGLVKDDDKDESDYSSDDERPLSKTGEKVKSPKVVVAKKSAAGRPKKPPEINYRITRSNKFIKPKIVSRRQQIKQRMLLTMPTIIKPRTLRSQTAQKNRILPEAKQKILVKGKKETAVQSKEVKKETTALKKPAAIKEKEKENAKREDKRESAKKVVTKTDAFKKAVSPTPAPKTKMELKKEVSAVKKEAEVVKRGKTAQRQSPEKTQDAKKKPTVLLKKNLPKSVEKPKLEDKPEEKSETIVKQNPETTEQRTSQRPTRKTKEAAAIYMEILSHKLVNEGRIDDDNVSIDSFPELPNVKKTEQRENELKAKARSGRTSESDKDGKREPEVAECKVLRSSDKKRNDGIDEEKVKKIIEEVKRTLAKGDKSAKEEGKKVKNDEGKKAKNDEGKKNVKNEGKEEGKKIVKNVVKEEGKKNEVKDEGKKGVKNVGPEGKRNVKNVGKEEGKKSEGKEEGKKNVKNEEGKKSVQIEGKEEGKRNEGSKDLKESVKEEEKKELQGKDEGKEEGKKCVKNEGKEDGKKSEGSEEGKEEGKMGGKLEGKEEGKKNEGKEEGKKSVKNEGKEEVKKNDEKEEGENSERKEEGKKCVNNEAKEEICDRKTRSANHDKSIDKEVMSPLEKRKEVELKVHIKPIEVKSESKEQKTDIKEVPKKKLELEEIPKKLPEPIEADFKKQMKRKPERSIDENGKKKVDKGAKKKCESIDSEEDKKQKKKVESETETSKRQTRNSSLNIRHVDSADSDESFRADIRVPRKKPVTRSKAETEESAKKETSYKEFSSESDHSTTSDVNVKRVTSSKNKKFTKTRVRPKEEQSFSDSDEEPLSKLTQNRKEEEEKPKEAESFVKPKRECAKRPQNYLPMFSSSSDEENYVQVLREIEKSRKAAEKCLHVPTTSDLSCKDIGRRFGKGKVNMSTEQIEKWLKDSAMAGNSVKNENDAMLKFGERIPTETSHSVANFIDTEQLKKLLVPEDKAHKYAEEPSSVTEKKEPKMETDKSAKQTSKVTPTIDRKLIFRNKDKGGGVNTKAFSVSNETSVYAFEETEDLMKTPFRRPARRPSSTATSRSEDEVKLEDLPKSAQFRRPSLVRQDKAKDSEAVDDKTSTEETNFNKPRVIERKMMTSMTPPSKPAPHPLDDPKYKVPSSPSASSSSSAKLSKRQTSNKYRACDVLPVRLPDFPGAGAPCGQLVEAPTFHPTEREFQDPLEYIEKIRAKAEQFGICRIVPPSTFKPECKVTDDMRFTAYNQYVHKMLHRWGPNFKELMAIKRYLSTQDISLTHPPWIGGMEIDLPRLYQTVQSLGGLKEVIEKKKWPKVSDLMKIPKSAQDRVTKLDDIYCKYLLPYDTLSPAEREKLFDEVETEWAKRESRSLLKAQQNVDDSGAEGESESDDEAEECIVKGRSMALNAFYRIARNTMSMWFKNQEPPAEEVEHEFWKHVTQKQNHICVHSGSIDSGNWGYGFAVSKNSPFARHAWNLKVLTNNSGSLLRAMGPVMGVTVPTLHVGMVFSSCCWYRDPHSLPWIEYLHTGGSKIWYGIPSSTGAAFHSALKTLVPNCCRNKSLWLPSDTVMVPPSLLVENGVSLCRIVQQPGQFVVVFPKVFTSSLSTGYVVSESVYFAPPYWLRTGRTVFDELRNSCEPSMFSYDRLLLSIVNDTRTNVEVLRQIIPAVQELCDREKEARQRVRSAGVSATEKLPLPEAPQVRKKKKMQSEDGEYECEICRMTLFISMVSESQDDAVYCLDHAAEQIEKKKIQSKHCKLEYTYDEQELDGLVEKIQAAITNKLQKKIPGRFTGMPTLLK